MQLIHIGDAIVIESICQTSGMRGVVKKVYPNLYGNGDTYISAYIEKIGARRMYNSTSVKILTKGKVEERMGSKFADCSCVVGVRFLQGVNTCKEYAFACYDENVKVGDVVLCDTVNGFSLAKVYSKYNKTAFGDVVTKEVVTVLDINSFEERVITRAKKADLKAKMDKRVKELQNIAIYETLAKDDEEMAKLLAEFKEI